MHEFSCSKESDLCQKMMHCTRTVHKIRYIYSNLKCCSESCCCCHKYFSAVAVDVVTVDALAVVSVAVDDVAEGVIALYVVTVVTTSAVLDVALCTV